MPIANDVRGESRRRIDVPVALILPDRRPARTGGGSSPVTDETCGWPSAYRSCRGRSCGLGATRSQPAWGAPCRLGPTSLSRRMNRPMVSGPTARRPLTHQCRRRRRAGDAHERQGRCIDATQPLSPQHATSWGRPPSMVVSGITRRSCRSNGRVTMPRIRSRGPPGYSQLISAELTEIVVVILEPDSTPM